jgi:hypothetical protein
MIAITMLSRWLILLLLSLLFCSTSSSTAQLSLDLSYLHSCPSDDLAVAIRETLTQQQQQKPIVDIDLTASLIGKNISGILESLKPFDNKNEGSPLQNPPLQTTTTTTTFVRLTARRNQWSSEDAIKILNFVLENGPNEIITNVSSVEEKDGDDSDNAGAAVVITEADDDNNITIDKNKEEEEDTTKTDGKIHMGNKNKPPLALFSIQSLDLGWNNLGRISGSRSASSGVRTMNKALRRLLSDSRQCPPSIRLNVCGLGPSSCRDIAKGIVERYDIKQGSDVDDEEEENVPLYCPPPLSLDLARNEGIGDAGVAALAAAIRTVASQQQRKENDRQKKKKESINKLNDENKDNDTEIDSASSSTTTEQDNDDLSDAYDSLTKTNTVVFERLDLSRCKIGDVGAEALAIALENHPLCVKYLDLSNNQISDEGAQRIARALGGVIDNTEDHHSRPRSNSGFVETLDLSNNNDLSDRGAKELARAFQEDGISNLILRSCNIKADGAAYFGNALRIVASQANGVTSSSSPSVSAAAERTTSRRRSIDLSGNPFGILTKKKSSGNKYSAKALRSKATATTSAYMNIIGKKIRGLSENINGEGLDTLESDDEEEDRMGDDDDDDSKIKCGALSFAEAFIDDYEDRAEESGVKSENNDDTIDHFELGLRHCSFDTRAAEALAAVLQESRQKYPRIKLTIDMTMNNVLEEDIIDALNGGSGYDDQLSDMADSYLDALEILREARERALKATRIAAARAKADAERESDWGSPPPGSRRHSRDDGVYRDDDEWDSVSDFDPSEEGSDDEYSW